MKHIKPTIGWCEWVALPELGLPLIQAKIESSFKVSILHVTFIETYDDQGKPMVRFGVHPKQKSHEILQVCESPVIQQEAHGDINGNKEQSFLIETLLVIDQQQFPIELELRKNDNMSFRLLLGHTAIDDRVLIAPSASYTLAAPTGDDFTNAYTI